MPLYLEGLAFGIVPVFFVGPVLFTLLSASLRSGFGAGAWVALGISVSDVVAIALCALGAGPLLTQSWGQWILSVAGGVILIGFGTMLGLHTAPADAELQSAPSSPWRLFSAGFLVNFVNPFVFTFWIGAIGGVSARHGFTAANVALFFAGMVTTIFVTDVLKALGAHRLRAHLSGPALRWTRRVSGLLLAACGLWLLIDALTELPKLSSL